MARAGQSSATTGDATTVTTPLLAPVRQVATDQSLVPKRRNLGDEFLRAIWIFQAGCALPMLFILGILAFIQLFESAIPLYEFVTYLGNALLAAGIVFLVIVQRRVPLDGVAEFRFEAAKSFFATGMWLWLLLDALLVHSGYQQWRRALRAMIASILLWILFYPSLAYAYWVWLETRRRKRDSEGHGELDADVVGEDTHLLSERS